MARKKTTETRLDAKAALSRRLKEIRRELFGEHGAPLLTGRLKLAERSWYNYERGVTIPGEILLEFIVQTGASPRWLLRGEGPKYLDESALNSRPDDDSDPDANPLRLIRRGLELLERIPGEAGAVSSVKATNGSADEFVPAGLMPLAGRGLAALEAEDFDDV